MEALKFASQNGISTTSMCTFYSDWIVQQTIHLNENTATGKASSTVTEVATAMAALKAASSGSIDMKESEAMASSYTAGSSDVLRSDTKPSDVVDVDKAVSSDSVVVEEKEEEEKEEQVEEEEKEEEEKEEKEEEEDVVKEKEIVDDGDAFDYKVSREACIDVCI